MKSIGAYQEVLERLPEPTLLVSAEGTVVGANGALARIGVEPRRLRGRRLDEVAAQPAGEVAAALRLYSRTSEPLPGALTLRGDDGGEVPCRADGNVLRPAGDDGPALVLLRLSPRGPSVARFLALNEKIEALGREVRRRERVEAELREQKEWLAVTLSSIGDAVIATDTGGRVIFMNPVAEGLTGWPRGEAAGRPLEDVFRIINEESRLPVENPVARCLREGVTVGLANHTLLIARDGAERAIDDTAAPIREPGGLVKGVVLIFHDVGERRRLERELRERAEHLADNDRRKDEFLAMLAHELRNPLAAISNAAQLLGALESEPDLEWARGVVRRQVRHLARMIDDLLDVSRISRGKIALRKEPLDLAPVVRAALEAVRPLLEERRHELSVSLVGGGLRLEADPLRLEQVLVNLLSNAARYTEAGGRIAVVARHEGGELVVTVEDNGTGIAPDLLPRVFDLFTQGDRPIARSEGGLGIGLTLVRRLVELHGGTVRAASGGPGKGSVFTVVLPALAEPGGRDRDPAADAPAARVARRGSRVLVVDDNVDNAQALSRLLQLLGHEVTEVHDGYQALDAARARPPEVVLLDIGLPGMDGHEVARRLRQEECGRNALIIAVSGYGQPEDRRRSREAGFDHHLVKPVDHDALLGLLALGR